ncbi:hypothetical protein [Streptosporangium sp. NPDC000396]|uniref:hypothetical protein n=1 Tax=Streptosporangium sp. NPDC000396 TaxID=3366185 RepID=UPI0036960FE4
MSVPDIFRNVTKNVREALSGREEFKEKAKDLPLFVFQSALSGVGQALLLGDRVKNRIKRLAGQDEDLDEPRQEAADQLDDVEADEEKPVRRKPVIFAPRPESTSPKDGDAGVNGVKARPEPVIFSPAKPKATEPKATEAEKAEPKATEPEKAEATTPETKPAEVEATETAAPAAETAEAEKAEAEKVQPEKAQPEKAEAEQAEAAVSETETIEVPATRTATPETEEAAPEAAAPAAVKVEVAKVEIATPETADTTVAEVTETKVAEPAVATPATDAITVPAEPMPGYAQLTIASLRARMRGKTAEQIRELLTYERATTARAEVVRMYENRLAKLEAAE